MHVTVLFSASFKEESDMDSNPSTIVVCGFKNDFSHLIIHIDKYLKNHSLHCDIRGNFLQGA